MHWAGHSVHSTDSARAEIKKFLDADIDDLNSSSQFAAFPSTSGEVARRLIEGEIQLLNSHLLELQTELMRERDFRIGAQQREAALPAPPNTGFLIREAASDGRLQDLQMFIEKLQGADRLLLNEGDSGHRNTPAMLASKNGHAECLLLLTNALGQEINTPITKNGAQAIHFAATYGKANCINILLNNGSDINAQKTNLVRGWTPLHCALAHGQLDAIRMLVLRGADLTIKDKNKQTAADLAQSIVSVSEKIEVDMSKSFSSVSAVTTTTHQTPIDVRNCFRIAVRDRDNASSLSPHLPHARDTHTSADPGVPSLELSTLSLSVAPLPLPPPPSPASLISSLLPHPPPSAVAVAAAADAAAAATASSSSSSSTNTKTGTQIRELALQGKASEIRLLAQSFITHTFPPGVVDEADSVSGLTALMKASWRGNIEVVNLLFKYGCDLFKVDKQGRSAISLAAEHGRDKCLSLLIAKERMALHALSLVDRADKDGNTPLHLASIEKREGCIAILIKEGSANASLRNNQGHSAFTCSTMESSKKALTKAINERGW